MNFDKYQALLFDCDGTIADSMPVHLVAWNRALEPHGITLTLAQHLGWAGRPTTKIVELLNAEYGAPEQRPLMDPAAIAHSKELAYLELIDTIQGIPAVLEVIRRYAGSKPMAVVSGSPRESVLKTLKQLKLDAHFPVVIGAEDYERGKPAPDCFLLAARALNVEPAHCLVFEDADLGVRAAESAAMAWVRVRPDRPDFDLAGSRF